MITLATTKILLRSRSISSPTTNLQHIRVSGSLDPHFHHSVGWLISQLVEWSEGLSASQSANHNFIKDREVPCSCGRTKTLPAEYHDGPTDADKSDYRVSCLTKGNRSVCVVCDSTFKGNSNKIYT